MDYEEDDKQHKKYFTKGLKDLYSSFFRLAKFFLYNCNDYTDSE